MGYCHLSHGRKKESQGEARRECQRNNIPLFFFYFQVALWPRISAVYQDKEEDECVILGTECTGKVCACVSPQCKGERLSQNMNKNNMEI